MITEDAIDTLNVRSGARGGRAVALKSVLPHVADRREPAAAPRDGESEPISVLRDYRAAGMTDYVDIINRSILGRDAGRRVLSGRIMRGVAERIDAVIWQTDPDWFTLTALGAGDPAPTITPTSCTDVYLGLHVAR